MAKVFLLGMPGSGKSTLGSKVAANLGVDFFDLDTLIENHEKCSIAEIFEQKGEQHFRETERKLLQAVIENSENFILATGGGTPCFYDNLHKMRSSGITVFIDPSLESIVERLSKTNIDQRPKLKDVDLKSTLIETYQIRLPFYSKANHTFSGVSANEQSLIKYIKSAI
ncbi:MAG: shikimate kinase [Bacteroidota bacterium]